MLAMLQETGDYVSVREIMKKFEISKRTVYYDLQAVNEWLSDRGLAPVEYVRGRGYLLPEESRSRIPSMAQEVEKDDYYLSPRERKAWVAIQLLTRREPLFMQEITDFLLVSRGTGLSELKQVKKELAAFQLEVVFDKKNGYSVEGKEADQRKALSYFMSQVLHHVSWKSFVSQFQGLINANVVHRKLPFFQEEQLAEVYEHVTRCEKTLGLEFTDDMVFSLTTRLLVYANRLQQGHRITLDADEKEALKQTPEYAGAVQLAGELGRMFDLEFPEDEICYLTLQLLGARVNRTSGGEALAAPGKDADADETVLLLKRLIRQMIDLFERHACIFFQHRDELEQRLLIHLKPAYYRIKFGLEIDNPLAEAMKSKYGEIFEISRKCVRPLEEHLGKPVDDNEVAYLAMHFGGWMRRENAMPVRRKKAAIVCVNGISAARMLRIQLEQLFPALDIEAVLSLRDYESFSAESVDLLFSTVPLQDSPAPVFTVHPILSDADKAHLLHQVNRVSGQMDAPQGRSAQAILEMVRKYARISDEEGLLRELQRYLSVGRSPGTEEEKPSLASLLPPEHLVLRDGASDWKVAIELAAEPLLRRGFIEPRYVKAMIAKVDSYGPYIVVSPGVAIAHAKPEEGVRRLGMSLLKLEHAVPFGPEVRHQIRLVLVLASADGESHLRALSQLTMLLREEEAKAILLKAQTAEQLAGLIRQHTS
ncbi:BglG family transcription antiterminator [Paenibacillus tyrfis]|uniref:BglG family transcription antiterminator n=1 Tax=Paenibacillus tyrfis TaxID=1501230 RepID=UPI000B58E988|nr:BglG family transcription antiterminator [Paenibacillus tyrfis]